MQRQSAERFLMEEDELYDVLVLPLEAKLHFDWTTPTLWATCEWGV